MATSYRQLTQLQKTEIIHLFHQGRELRTIPGELDVSERSVARVLAESKVNTKRRNRYTLDECYFQSIDTPTKAYLLGLLAADGCVTEKNYIVYESIEQELTNLFISEFNYSGELRVIYPPGGYAPHYRINFSSKQMSEHLRSWGVIAGRGDTGEIQLPEGLFLGSYLLGYFDGDGCAYRNRGRSGGLVCIVAPFKFAERLRNALKMGTIIEHCKKKVYYWRIFGRTDIQKFYNLVYTGHQLGLTRKRQKIEAILGSYCHG